MASKRNPSTPIVVEYTTEEEYAGLDQASRDAVAHNDQLFASQRGEDDILEALLDQKAEELGRAPGDEEVVVLEQVAKRVYKREEAARAVATSAVERAKRAREAARVNRDPCVATTVAAQLAEGLERWFPGQDLGTFTIRTGPVRRDATPAHYYADVEVSYEGQYPAWMIAAIVGYILKGFDIGAFAGVHQAGPWPIRGVYVDEIEKAEVEKRREREAEMQAQARQYRQAGITPARLNAIYTKLGIVGFKGE